MAGLLFFLLALLAPAPAPAAPPAPSPAPRARDLGIPLDGHPGPRNALTDVAGVEVGHCTLLSGEGPAAVRTGVTAVLPRGRIYDPVFAALHVLNGNGEMTGAHWITESGFLESPVLLTNTHAIGPVHAGALLWMRDRGYFDGELAALPVVAETWDGLLNGINAFPVEPAHAVAALDAAASGPVAEGNVGGGTGMVCFRFKGGIGTASRLFSTGGQTYTLGALVQANFGRREDLVIAGRPVGRLLAEEGLPRLGASPPAPAGPTHSLLVILATDAPLLPHQLRRVAQRGVLGLGRTGGAGRNSSGDFFLAFSTANPGAWFAPAPQSVNALPNTLLDPVFLAAIEATEEAILNALIAAETLTGLHGATVFALPEDKVAALFASPGP